MRPHPYRRLGAALLLALFVPGCTDVPTLPDPSGPAPSAAGRGVGAPPPDFPSERGIPGLVEQRQTRGELDVRLYSGRDGKLRHLAARRLGHPAVHLRWHYRADGGLDRVSATIYGAGGRSREIPDVALAAGAAPSRALAPAAGPVLSSAAESCWAEWFVVLDLALALIMAELDGDLMAVGPLTLALMKASLDLQLCIWRNGNQF